MINSTQWYRAIRLKERIAYLKSNSAKLSLEPVQLSLAKERLKRWRAILPLKNNKMFAQRLASDNITEEEFLYLLGEPVDKIKENFAGIPEWLQIFVSVFNQTEWNKIVTDSLLAITRLKSEKLARLLSIFDPLINKSLKVLHKRTAELFPTNIEQPFDLVTIEHFFLSGLLENLFSISISTLVEKLIQVREDNLITGNTSEEKFVKFLHYLNQPAVALDFFQQYPVLARQAVVLTNRWIDQTLTFFQRLSLDWPEIIHCFSRVAAPGKLILSESAIQAGDPHTQGAVIIAGFTSGFKLVYKPRPVGAENHFQNILSWLNQKGARFPFRLMKVLERGTYGWIEFIEKKSCVSIEQVHNFYQRQGAFLAVLYVLGGSDIHIGNLIAEGENPVLLDLEVLFTQHPKLNIFDSIPLTENTMAYSVISSGLLNYTSKDKAGADASGLFQEPGYHQLSLPYRHIIGESFDDARFVNDNDREIFCTDQNRPTLADTTIDPVDYAEDIVDGFEETYRLILQFREELLTTEGLLTSFVSDEIRVLLQDTLFYYLIMEQSYQPNILRSALAHECILDYLWVNASEMRRQVISFEKENLLNFNIPKFLTTAGSCDLYIDLADRREAIPGFFNQSGMETARKRIESLCEKDLTHQLYLVRAAITTSAFNKHIAITHQVPLTTVEKLSSPREFLTMAESIGNRLAELSVRNQHGTTWQALKIQQKTDDIVCRVGLLDTDLYDGISGIALFLGYLGELLDSPHYRSLAQSTIEVIINKISSNRLNLESLGFNGLGGLIYTLTNLGILWKDEELITQAHQLIPKILPLVSKDSIFDILYGAAGAIVSLLRLYDYTGSKAALNLALDLGEHLISQAQTMSQGIAWVNSVPQAAMLGMSHGTAGIAWALLELFKRSKRENFRNIALAAITYERSLFSYEVKNWPNLAHGEKEYSVAWCKGAPGIGLARLSCLDSINDETILDEIKVAMETTLTAGFGKNYTLCHGDLGNLDFLLQASQILKDQELHIKVYTLATSILESIKSSEILSGTQISGQILGLMVGLAGIGYQMLRLASPQQVPSVLSLDIRYSANVKATTF
ncbi:MAG: type 2 lanthipeptide synthetase LanM family protein [Acidobacteriota bacterium]